MLAFISGKVLFSDGIETIISTESGLGYQIFYNKILPEGEVASLFVSHIIRETEQRLYGFDNIRAKKLFELLLTVKNVGPKSAYALMSALPVTSICDAILLDNKRLLATAPGLGAKSAAQIVLDLSSKIQKIKMYSPTKMFQTKGDLLNPSFDTEKEFSEEDECLETNVALLDETIMACKELGFKETEVRLVAKKVLATSSVKKAEQLVHLVLKEL